MAWENGELITAVKLNNMEDQIEENNMSYEKHTWETGELITADKLNHMEEGIEGGGGSPVNPIMTINVVNNTGGGFPISYTDYIDNKLTFVIHPVVESTATLSIPWPWFDIVESYAHDVYILTNFNSETCTITNLVNCFFPFAEDDDYGTVQITDSTLPASFTFTALSLQ